MKKIIFILAFFLFSIQNNIQAQKISALTKVTSVKASDYVPLNIELGATDSTRAILIQNFYKSLKTINDTSAYRIFIVPTRDTTTIGAFYRVMNDSVLVFNKISTRKDTIATWARVRQFGFDTSKAHTLTNSLNIRSKLSLQGVNGRLILPDLADSLGGIYKFNNSLLSRYSLGYNYDASNNKDTLITNNALRLWLATKSNYLKTTYPMALNGDSLVMRYQPVNLKLTNNRLDLIQNIRTTDLPTFAGFTAINGTANTSALLPLTGYTHDIGVLTNKYRSLFAAELWVETLVAQNTIATIGGRVLIGETNILVADLASGDTHVHLKYNNFANGDRVYMEANSSVEFIAIASSASGSAGNYQYTITRNLDGSGANNWYAGDAMFNTGTTGDGFIDLYSVNSIKGASQLGPSIVGNVRNSSTYNDITEHWAIGNLYGLYGYGANNIYGIGLGKYANSSSYITIDPTNGFALKNKSAGGTETKVIELDASGNAYFRGNITSTATITGGYLQTSDRTNTALNCILIDGSNNALEFRKAGRSSATDYTTRISNDVYGSIPGIELNNGVFYSHTDANNYTQIISGNTTMVGDQNGNNLTVLSSADGFDITGSIYGASFGDVGQTGVAIYGAATSASYNYGIRGSATGTATKNYGIFGQASGGTENYGSFSEATGAATVNYGIVAQASGGTTNWAAYFNGGNVYVKDELQVGANKFNINSTGQLIKVNNIAATNKYSLVGDGTSFTPRLLTVSDLTALTASKIAITDASGYLSASTLASSILFSSQYGVLNAAGTTDTLITRSAGYNKFDYTTVTKEVGVSGSAGTDVITISVAGDYKISYDVSYTANTSGGYYWACTNSSAVAYANTRNVQYTAANTQVHIHGETIVTLAATDTVALGCTGGTGNVVTVIYASLVVQKISN